MNKINIPASTPSATPTRAILVSDFDGTITQRDFYDLVRQQWPVPPDDDPWERYVAGQITHFEALAAIFARIRTDERTLLELAGRMGMDQQMSDAVQRLQRRGWDVVVASAGCDWYIRRLLSEAGVNIVVHSNPGKFVSGAGLQMSLPTGSPFFSRSTGIDKVAIVRDALRRSSEVAFAGDGRPDLESALLVEPELRFARGWLAEELTRRNEPFHPFAHWSQIADKLLEFKC